MHMRRGEYMLEEVAKDAWEYGRKFLLQGKVADYIPELGKANPVHFGLCIAVRLRGKRFYRYSV